MGAGPGGVAEGVVGPGVGVEELESDGGGNDLIDEDLVHRAVRAKLGPQGVGVVGDGGGERGHGCAGDKEW